MASRVRSALLPCIVTFAAAVLGVASAASAADATHRASPGPDLRAAVEGALYRIEPHPETTEDCPAFRAENRRQRLRARFDCEGFRVERRSGERVHAWRLTLRAVGRGDRLTPVPPVAPAASGNRVQYEHRLLTEWYLNDPRGIEQGFTIGERPAGSPAEPVRLELAMRGDLAPMAGESGEAIALGARDGGPAVLRYGSLVAFDATGRRLPARLHLSTSPDPGADRLQLVVDDTGATYPVTIDPLVGAAETMKLVASDASADDRFAASVAISGDLAVVGAFDDDDGGTSSGSAYVFFRDQGGSDAWGQIKKLTASDDDPGDFFGQAVAISGDIAVVGASLDDEEGSLAGAAYVFARDQGGPDAWGEVKKLTASDAAGGELFGRSVAISGDTILVGALGAGAGPGTAYVFSRDQGGPDAWGEVAKLSAPDEAALGRFAASVALSGDTAVVGAAQSNDAGNRSGSAYIFSRDQGGPDTWGEVKKLTASDAAAEDEFGYRVAIDGDTVVVGAHYDDDGGSGSGSAYVFLRDQGGPAAWGEVAKLTAPDAAELDFFGSSVSISGDLVLVGATRDDAAGLNSGSAYVFSRDEGGTNAWGAATKIVASDGAADDQLGSAVAISGTTAVVGAAFGDSTVADSGSAYVFTLAEGTTRLVPSDGGLGFGAPVAASGDAAVVGAVGDDHAGDDSGSAYVFVRRQGEVAKLVASDAAAHDQFGFAVALSGDTAVAGSPYDSDTGFGSGSAYVFWKDQGGPSAWGEVTKLTPLDPASGDNFGTAVGISGDTAVVGSPGDGDAGFSSGSAYVFSRDLGGPDAWGQARKLTALDAAFSDNFGYAVAISGDTAVATAPLEGVSGSAYVFSRDQGGAGNWGQVAKLTPSDAASNYGFGEAVAISGDTILVGAPYKDPAGSVYVFSRNEGGPDAWGEVTQLAASGLDPDAFFGGSLAASGDFALVGAPDDDLFVGAAYVFVRNVGGPDAWGEVAKLTPFDGGFGAFGASASASGSAAVIGSFGAAYAFDLAACGDGALDEGEGCDDGGDTPGDGCDATCQVEPGYSCSGEPSVCTPPCGNGLPDPGEECDDGGESATCDADCTFALCGDGNANATAGESCDEGGETATCDADCSAVICGDGTANSAAGEICDDGGESATCDLDCTPASCGDSTHNATAGEACDDGGESATCDPDCTLALCGDGTPNATAGEACDEGGETATCDADCTAVSCGDGHPNAAAGEQCDDSGESASCDADCTLAVCGDSTLNTTAGEICDEGGETPTCDADCTPVGCGDGETNASAGEQCDDAGESATCDLDCTLASCGDSTLNTTAGESCDDGGESAICDTDCTPAACGDATVNATAGEACDDGGESAGCDADCTPVSCGDGVVNEPAGEQCDDGNGAPGDGCDSLCQVEPGFSCPGEPSVCSAQSADVSGSWQINYSCASGLGPFTGTAFRQLDHDVPTGVVTSTLTATCGSILAQERIHALGACSLTPDPELGTVAGSQLALPTSGHSAFTGTAAVPFNWPDVWTDAECGSANDLIAELELVVRSDLTISDDGQGKAIRLDGTADFSGVTLTNSDDATCGPLFPALSCDLVGLPNGVEAGPSQAVEPYPDASITFDEVTSPGEVEIVLVTTPSASVPGNFVVFDRAFQITTTADFSGDVEVCLPYLDEDDDGFEDTTHFDETLIRIFHDEGGTPVDRTSSLDPVGNQVCAVVSGFSDFVLAVQSVHCPVAPTLGCADTVGSGGKSILLVRDKGADGVGPRDQLLYKWVKGPQLNQADFGDPTDGGDHHLCMYEEDGGDFRLVLSLTAPTGGFVPLGSKGWKLIDPQTTHDGILKVIEAGGNAGKSRALVVARGGNLPAELASVVQPSPSVTRWAVELHNDDNTSCVGSVFDRSTDLLVERDQPGRIRDLKLKTR